MKVTHSNGKIIIDLEEAETTNQIIAMIKTFEEQRRVAAEETRSMGFIGSAMVDEIRADTANHILVEIYKILH